MLVFYENLISYTYFNGSGVKLIFHWWFKIRKCHRQNALDWTIDFLLNHWYKLRTTVIEPSGTPAWFFTNWISDHLEQLFENLPKYFVNCQKPYLGLIKTDLDRTHRIDKNDKRSNWPKPVIVKFIRYNDRKKVFSKKNSSKTLVYQ